jgi:glycosyltransferase involved in cell wall biosynthesis
LKIALLSYFFPPDSIGGTATYAYELSKALSKRGHDVTVFTAWHTTPPSVSGTNISCEGVKVTSLPGFRFLSYILSVKHFAKWDEFDIIHSSAGAGVMAPRIDVETHHHFPLSLLAMPNYVPVYLSLRKARHIIAVGSTSFYDLLRIGIDRRLVSTIDSGADPTKFVPSSDMTSLRKRLGLPGSFVFIYVGGIKKDKNTQLLVKTISSLTKKGKNVFLLVIGSGPESTRLSNLCFKSIPGRYRIEPFVDSSLLPLYYAAADAFLFPSKKEGFGLVLLEALASGLTIVSKRAGVADQLVNSRFCQVADSDEDFVGKCVDLVEAPRKSGQAGNDYVRLNYSWDRTAREAERIYQRLSSGDSQ